MKMPPEPEQLLHLVCETLAEGLCNGVSGVRVVSESKNDAVVARLSATRLAVSPFS